MAEISSGFTGPGRLAVRIDILDRVRGTGMVAHGPIIMNAALGVLQAEVSFWLGEREIFAQEIWLHHMSVEGWLAAVEALISGQAGECKRIVSGPESPELIMTVRCYGPVPNGPLFEDAGRSYELLIVVDPVVLAPSRGVTGEGPGMRLTPTGRSLLQFASDLLAEAEDALTHRGYLPLRAVQG